MSKPLVIGPRSRKQEMFISDLKDVDVVIFGGGAGCFDSDTEFLSPEGWVRIAEWDNHKVAQYDAGTSRISFTIPNDYIKLPAHNLTRMRAKGLDFCLSDEHRVPYWTYNNKESEVKVLSFDEVKKRHADSKFKGWGGYIKTSYGLGDAGLDLTEGELRLEVAVQADGRVVANGANNYTQMRFSKYRKYSRLINLCREYNLPHKDNASKFAERYSNETEYEVIVYPLKGTKIFTSEWYAISQKQAEIIADEVRYWDASTVERKAGDTVRYFSKHKENVDFIQYVFHACGYNTSIVVDSRDGSYTLNATKQGNGFRSFQSKGSKVPMEDYQTTDGFKYCFTVPTSYLLMRRSNKIFISGNCGKSYLGAMDLLKGTDDPKFRGLVVRRLTPQIHGPGGIFETVKTLHGEVYGATNLKIDHRQGIIKYPSGATITFRHCQYEEDKHSFQGWQISSALLDEVQQLTQSMVVYIMSRLRSEAKDKSKMRMTCNPAGKGHWLTNWLEWYLQEDGLPDPERCGVIRYFTMKDNEMIWGATPEEVKHKVPGCYPLSFSFVSAVVYDNPVLMERQPEYVAWLEGQDRETKEALLYGNWYVTKQSEGYFKRKWTPVVTEPPFIGRRARGFDLAGSIVDEVNKDPDYTASVLLSKNREGNYCIEHADHIRERFHTVEEYIMDLSDSDPSDIVYVLPVDAGAAGKAYASGLQKRLAEKGRVCRLFPHSTKSKLVRFRPLASVCEGGFVSVVSADWNDWYFDELEQFIGDGKTHDDALDATVSAFWSLNQHKEFGNIVLPNLVNKLVPGGRYGTEPIYTGQFTIPTFKM